MIINIKLVEKQQRELEEFYFRGKLAILEIFQKLWSFIWSIT